MARKLVFGLFGVTQEFSFLTVRNFRLGAMRAVLMSVVSANPISADRGTRKHVLAQDDG